MNKVKTSEADHFVSDCPMAAEQIVQEVDEHTANNPMSLLRRPTESRMQKLTREDLMSLEHMPRSVWRFATVYLRTSAIGGSIWEPMRLCILKTA